VPEIFGAHQKPLPVWHPSRAYMPMDIANNEKLLAHVPVLPPSWGTPYAISQLTGETAEPWFSSSARRLIKTGITVRVCITIFLLYTKLATHREHDRGGAAAVAQGELHPLEVGLHALRSELSDREYATRRGDKHSNKVRTRCKQNDCPSSDLCESIADRYQTNILLTGGQGLKRMRPIFRSAFQGQRGGVQGQGAGRSSTWICWD
jgi:hypothetical protein